MKTLFTLFFFFSSIQVFAASPQRYSEVSLSVVYITDFSPLKSENVNGGTLVIDHYADSAQLILDRAMPACPEGMFCPMVMPAPLEITFENLQIQEDPCGSFIFTAAIENHLAGFFETLEIVDNTYNTCETLDILDQFEVTYETFSAHSLNASRALFKGPRESDVTLPVQPLATM